MASPIASTIINSADDAVEKIRGSIKYYLRIWYFWPK